VTACALCCNHLLGKRIIQEPAVTDQDLARRVARLEAIQEISRLKYAYFFNCDQQRPDKVRECFIDGEVDIDFGRIGRFRSADELVAVFEQLACQEHIVEMHHAQNPQIDLLGDDRATGLWGLYYYMIDTRQQIATQLGGYYEDEYRYTEGGWKMSASRFVVTSTQILDLGEAVVKRVFAGRTAPAELDDPSRQGD
jgi:hypothetical protein